ncbi:hypothetical protein HF313_22615 [Massilia atriviolacea]|uniref:Uncharacterized protein n=1 Tax=Massilia atriviolacea TaxID=2495579 RepID=A0A430HFM4_9BURK|nr:hypothetical protein [Massilia atriviolacea]RSZ56328.1 hypothetical protein EJB06_24705 [Massilia atriviolacea]
MNKLTLLPLILALAACGKPGVPDTPLEAAARRTCSATIEARATNPKSIAWLGDTPTPVKHGANGQMEVAITFSAKDALGTAVSMLAICQVGADGKTLVNIAVKDSR